MFGTLVIKVICPAKAQFKNHCMLSVNNSHRGKLLAEGNGDKIPVVHDGTFWAEKKLCCVNFRRNN